MVGNWKMFFFKQMVSFAVDLLIFAAGYIDINLDIYIYVCKNIQFIHFKFFTLKILPNQCYLYYNTTCASRVFAAKLHLLKDVEHGMAQRIAPHTTMVGPNNMWMLG